jgi:hypothetical protein
MRTLVCVSVLGLALAGAAQAGGWATVGIEPLPDGASAGREWAVQVTVLQHGVTPLEGVRPVVGITGPAGDRREFGAEATSEPGVYRANVVFPKAGRWTVDVHDGFTQFGGAQTHTFGAFEIAPAGPNAFPTWLVVLGALAALAALAAAVAVILARRRRPSASGAAQAASR